MNEIEKRFFKEETGFDYDTEYDGSSFEMEILEAKANAKITIDLMREAYMQSYDDNVGDIEVSLKSIIEYNFENFIKNKYGVDLTTN